MIKALILTLLLLFPTASCATYSEQVLERAAKLSYYTAEYNGTKGDSHKAYLVELEARALEYGITLQYVPEADLQGNVGMTIPEHRWIQIVESLPPNSKLEILAHEMAHVFQPRTLSGPEREVFADLIAVEYCRSVGLDIRSASAGYLPIYKSGFHVLDDWKIEFDMVLEVLQGKRKP